MKKLILVLLLLPSLTIANPACVKYSKLVEKIAGLRDAGAPLSAMIEVSDDKFIISMIKDVYTRTYLTPVRLGNYWMLKCLKWDEVSK